MVNKLVRLCCAMVLAGTIQILSPASGAAAVDLRQAIAAGDLDFTEPTVRSEEGMPVGNGKMGSLVWTTPSAIKMQINRVDVFGMDSNTVSFPRADSDYASGCAFLDINVNEAGDDVFAGPSFNQHLSVYDGVMSLRGNGVTARVIGWPAADVMAVEVEDQRANPEPISVDLRMLRFMMQGYTRQNYNLAKNHIVMVQTANHYAASQLHIREGRIALTQIFKELEFYDASGVAVAIQGRESKARYLNDFTVRLTAAPGKGKFTILIASAASFDPNDDAAALALANLDKATAKDFSALAADTAAWWKNFWEKGHVAMSSPDKQADFVGGNYIYFMYLMGASSRGDYPPRFGGMLWYTNGDYRRWGSQYWHANTAAYYRDLMPSGHVDLMDPFFNLYHGMYDEAARAARQQWGSQGIWLPEITFFNGPDTIPDNLVQEFQDLFLVRKPFDQASREFMDFVTTKNRHNSRYNFLYDGKYIHGRLVVPTKGQGIFGHCTHFFSGMAGTANNFWQRYEFTLDEKFLRDKGYPMIKGVAEFYRNFPNLKKEADGKWHIHHVNNIESHWDSSDTPAELGALRTIFPLAIKASEILGVDEDLRPLWRDIAENVADPAPGSGKRSDAGVGSGQAAGAPVFDENGRLIVSPTPTPTPTPSPQATNDRPRRARVRGYGGFIGGTEGSIEPLGSEPELKARFLQFNTVGGFVDPIGVGGAEVYRNRLRLREGPGAIDAEHIGGLAFGIHQSLLETTASAKVETVSIKVFPQWPKEWDVTYRLLARGATTVVASQVGGKIQFVQLQPQVGGKATLVNPWPGTELTLYRGSQNAGDFSGDAIELELKKDETLTAVPKGEGLPAI